ncbi:hypothetical protein K474DRAFT_1637857 [Panus rudis PR-1116 ss-1]|nr:hypothetical protein K474DRAFT_1637857 [Panus rudis PR-1116 ss-1]
MAGPSATTPLLRSVGRAFSGSTFLWRSGAILATIGIITGAFGAHGLRKRPGITPDNIHAWETASHYASVDSPKCLTLNCLSKVFNGLALLLVSLHPRFAVHRFAGPAIIAGSTLFSGSIFALVGAKDRLNLKWLGPVTPIGGSILIAG